MNQNPTHQISEDQAHTCKTCANTFRGKYCNACGEKIFSPHERTFGHFLHEIFHVLTHADGKIWRNLKLLIKSPGTISKTIAEGSRVRLMPPVSMFFVANLIYFLFPLFDVFNTSLHEQIHGHFYGPVILTQVESRMEKKHITFEELAEKYNKKTSGVSKLILIVMVPFFAIVYMILHFRSKRLFADHILIGLEFMTYTLFYNIIFFSIILIIAKWLSGVIGMNMSSIFENEFTLILPVVLLSTIYFVYRAERTFYEQKIFRAILKTMAFVAFFPMVVFLYRFILFHITMALI